MIPQTVLCCSHPVWPVLGDPSNSLMLQPSSLASSWRSLKQSYAAAIQFGQFLVIPQTVLCCSHPFWPVLGDPSNSLMLQPSSLASSWWSLKQSSAAAIKFGQFLVIPQTVLCCSHPVGTDLGDPSNSLVLQPSSRDRSWWSLKQCCAAAIQ